MSDDGMLIMDRHVVCMYVGVYVCIYSTAPYDLISVYTKSPTCITDN